MVKNKETWKFRLPPKLKTRKGILVYAERYDYKEKRKENKLLRIAKRAMNRGYMTKQEFLALCLWKSQRPRKHYESNDAEMVKAVSKIAFSKKCPETLRFKIFTLLKGVKTRMASAILHLAYLDAGTRGGYPIMDFRALGALGCRLKDNDKRYEEPAFWSAYTLFCRRKARQFRIGMRELDRALWQYNNENG